MSWVRLLPLSSVGAYIVARDKGQLGELLHKAQTNGARNVDWAPSLPEGVRTLK